MLTLQQRVTRTECCKPCRERAERIEEKLDTLLRRLPARIDIGLVYPQNDPRGQRPTVVPAAVPTRPGDQPDDWGFPADRGERDTEVKPA